MTTTELDNYHTAKMDQMVGINTILKTLLDSNADHEKAVARLKNLSNALPLQQHLKIAYGLRSTEEPTPSDLADATDRLKMTMSLIGKMYEDNSVSDMKKFSQEMIEMYNSWEAMSKTGKIGARDQVNVVANQAHFLRKKYVEDVAEVVTLQVAATAATATSLFFMAVPGVGIGLAAAAAAADAASIWREHAAEAAKNECVRYVGNFQTHVEEQPGMESTQSWTKAKTGVFTECQRNFSFSPSELHSCCISVIDSIVYTNQVPSHETLSVAFRKYRSFVHEHSGIIDDYIDLITNTRPGTPFPDPPDLFKDLNIPVGEEIVRNLVLSFHGINMLMFGSMFLLQRAVAALDTMANANFRNLYREIDFQLDIGAFKAVKSLNRLRVLRILTGGLVVLTTVVGVICIYFTIKEAAKVNAELEKGIEDSRLMMIDYYEAIFPPKS
jgi:hypothetical protein